MSRLSFCFETYLFPVLPHRPLCVRLAEFLHHCKSHTVSGTRKKTERKAEEMFREISKVEIVFERIWGTVGGRKVLAKTNAVVCLLSSDSGLYHSSGSYSLLYHFRGKQTFSPPSFFNLHSSACLCTEMCAIMQPPQPSSLQTERRINEDTEIRGRGAGGAGLLRYGSTLT